jgi:hypothetical protein
VSSELLKIGSSPGEHHLGIHEDQPAISDCHRRTTPLKPEMASNEAELSEQVSFKVDQKL